MSAKSSQKHFGYIFLIFLAHALRPLTWYMNIIVDGQYYNIIVMTFCVANITLLNWKTVGRGGVLQISESKRIYIILSAESLKIFRDEICGGSREDRLRTLRNPSHRFCHAINSNDPVDCSGTMYNIRIPSSRGFHLCTNVSDSL